MPHQCTGCGQTFEDGSKEMLSGCPECGGNKFQFRPAGADFPEDPDPPEPDSTDDGAPDGDSSVAETVGRATTRVRDFVSSSPSEEPDPNAAWPSESGADEGTTASADDGPTASDGDAGDDGEIIDADARREAVDAGEDAAQASARSGLASSGEIRDVGAGEEPTSPDPSDRPSTGTDEGAVPGGNPLAAGGQPPADDDQRVVSEPSGEEPELSELREQLNDQFESIKIVEPGQYELNLMELYDREEYIIALQENGRYVIQVPDQWIGEDVDDR